ATDTNSIILTRTGGAAAFSGALSFELGNGTTNGFTNPSGTGSFYARIHTYTTTGGATAHDEDAATGYGDYGGIALSTAAVISITARVQETLSFCVYEGGGACGVNAPTITIGHD